MSNRITNAMLERTVERINDALGVPNEPYQTDADGKVLRKDGHTMVNAGCVYIAGAYGGTRLEQMSEGGGCRDFLSTGYETKRTVYNMAQAWLSGRESAA